MKRILIAGAMLLYTSTALAAWPNAQPTAGDSTTTPHDLDNKIIALGEDVHTQAQEDIQDTCTPGTHAIQSITKAGVTTCIEVGATGGVDDVTEGTGITVSPTTGSVVITLTDTSVTPAEYVNPTITVNQQGQITAAANGADYSPDGENGYIQYYAVGVMGADIGLQYNEVSQTAFISHTETNDTKFMNDGLSYGVSLLAPALLAADWTLTLPPDNGDNGQFLQTDGSGGTDWVTISGGGDMLGSNNLSDVDNAATSATNLGLGTSDDVTFAAITGLS